MRLVSLKSSSALKWSAVSIAAGLALAACTPIAGAPARATGPSGVPLSIASTTLTVDSPTALPLVVTDISRSINAVRGFASGANWFGGVAPGPLDRVEVPPSDGDVEGQLSVTAAAGAAAVSMSQIISVTGVGNPLSMALTIRGSSSDAGTLVDILHRPTNPGVDYLLTGDALRAVAPTPWVTVPAQFGSGTGCIVPGRQVICQVTADLLANQQLVPSMPTNSSIPGPGFTTIHSAITVRQLLSLDAWMLRRTAGDAFVKAASKSDLDLTLVPITLVYENSIDHLFGRPVYLTINAAVTVSGQQLSFNLQWNESIGGQNSEIGLAAPTRSLYTVLDATKAAALHAAVLRGH